MSLLPKLALADSLPFPGWLLTGKASPHLSSCSLWWASCLDSVLVDITTWVTSWGQTGPPGALSHLQTVTVVQMGSLLPALPHVPSPGRITAQQWCQPHLPSPLPSPEGCPRNLRCLSQLASFLLVHWTRSPCMMAHLALTLLRAMTCLHVVQNLFLKHLFTIFHFSNLWWVLSGGNINIM